MLRREVLSPQTSQCGYLVLYLVHTGGLGVATLLLLLAAPSRLPAAVLVLLTLVLVLATPSTSPSLRLLTDV